MLKAAFRLFAERGADAVPINEITDAADVGFGSFYNHFPSKEAIHEAVLTQVFDAFGEALERLAAGIEDPAEVIAVSVRHALQRAQREPLWGKLLVRESYQGQVLARGLGPRLLRDIGRGMASGRFSTPDPLVSFIVVGSSVLGAITALLLPPEAARLAEAASLDTRTGDLDVRTAAAALHVLGLTRSEAERVARRPLPVVEFP
ncbi:TetR/AcrR family transcriptional regulator [Corallococcus coralloides]|uniref:TetR/AcrR family transcriptional regulator n=1 Tax=Corallococcus coralloides TaxID=184914 RepID=UPI00385096C0